MKNKAAQELGKLGGLVKSEAKTQAARANAKKPRNRSNRPPWVESQELVEMGKDERIRRLTNALKIILAYDPGTTCPLCESGERFEIQALASEAPGVSGGGDPNPPKNAAYWKRMAKSLEEENSRLRVRIVELEHETADIALIAHMQGAESAKRRN